MEKQEPNEIPREKPERFRQQVLRALSEGLIEVREAEQLLNDTLDTALPRSLIARRAFLELPTDVRRNLLKEQAKQMADHYERDSEWRELEGEPLSNTNPLDPHRGEVWDLNFDPTIGSEIQKTRPR